MGKRRQEAGRDGRRRRVKLDLGSQAVRLSADSLADDPLAGPAAAAVVPTPVAYVAPSTITASRTQGQDGLLPNHYDSGSEGEAEGAARSPDKGPAASATAVTAATGAAKPTAAAQPPHEAAAAAAAAAVVVELPADWHESTDDSGSMYYWNSVTRQTQWHLPEGATTAAKTTAAPAPAAAGAQTESEAAPATPTPSEGPPAVEVAEAAAAAAAAPDHRIEAPAAAAPSEPSPQQQAPATAPTTTTTAGVDTTGTQLAALSGALMQRLAHFGVSTIQPPNWYTAMYVQLQTRLADSRLDKLPAAHALAEAQAAELVLQQHEQQSAPAGWACVWDPASCRYYYQHSESSTVQWERPSSAHPVTVVTYGAQRGTVFVEKSAQPPAFVTNPSMTKPLPPPPDVPPPEPEIPPPPPDDQVPSPAREQWPKASKAKKKGKAARPAKGRADRKAASLLEKWSEAKEQAVREELQESEDRRLNQIASWKRSNKAATGRDNANFEELPKTWEEKLRELKRRKLARD